MKELRLRYSDELEAAMHLTPEELEARFRLMAALKMFELGMLSAGKAAELAQLCLPEFLDACGQYGVSPFNYADEEIEAELLSDVDAARKARR